VLLLVSQGLPQLVAASLSLLAACAQSHFPVAPSSDEVCLRMDALSRSSVSRVNGFLIYSIQGRSEPDSKRSIAI